MPKQSLQLAILALLTAIAGCRDTDRRPPDKNNTTRPAQTPAAAPAARPVVLGVNDPFCRQTGSACVAKGHYREYVGLAEAMGKHIGRPVELRYFHLEPQLIEEARLGRLDGVICKSWTALRAAKAAGAKLHRLADVSMPAVRKAVGAPELTGRETFITLIPAQEDLRGILFTLDNSPIKTLADLSGRKLAVGNEDSYEKSHAVRRLLLSAASQPELVLRPTCLGAALAVKEGESDAAVISSYAYLFGTAKAVELPPTRVIALTEPIPFITVGVFDKMDAASRDRLRELLLEFTTHTRGVPADLGPTRIMPPADWRPAELDTP